MVWSQMGLVINGAGHKWGWSQMGLVINGFGHKCTGTNKLNRDYDKTSNSMTRKID